MSELRPIFEDSSEHGQLGNSLKIRITSLSSGGKHPLSNITEKDIFIDALESSDLEARIVGDEVLIDSTVDDEDWGVEFAHIVISWKTGRIRTVNSYPLLHVNCAHTIYFIAIQNRKCYILCAS